MIEFSGFVQGVPYYPLSNYKYNDFCTIFSIFAQQILKICSRIFLTNWNARSRY